MNGEIAIYPDAPDMHPADERLTQVLDLPGPTTDTNERREPGGKVIENRLSVLNCSAPTLDTTADFNIDHRLVPPAPSGEPASTIRFVSHDDVVDVYLAPNPEGGFY